MALIKQTISYLLVTVPERNSTIRNFILTSLSSELFMEFIVELTFMLIYRAKCANRATHMPSIPAERYFRSKAEIKMAFHQC
jgi:hypothetical protein